MRVLVVEDSKFLRTSIERALKTAGYEVISSGDGEQALSLAREHEPALILLDIMLPKMSGPEVALVIEATRHGAKGHLRFQLRAKPRA